MRCPFQFGICSLFSDQFFFPASIIELKKLLILIGPTGELMAMFMFRLMHRKQIIAFVGLEEADVVKILFWLETGGVHKAR